MVNKYIKAILDNSLESIVLIGKNHEVLAFNKAAKTVLFQYFRKEIKEGDLYFPDFVIESHHKLYEKAFRKALQGKPFQIQEHTVNEYASFWFDYKMQPIYDEQDLLIGVSLSARDVTAEKAARLKMMDISEKLNAILENTTESILLFDFEFKVLVVNSFAKKLYKELTGGEIEIGNNIISFMNPKNVGFFLQQYEKVLKGEIIEVELYTESLLESRWLFHRLMPVYAKNDEKIGTLWVIKDVSHRKEMELLLRESEEKFRSIFNTAPISMIILDENKIIQDINTQTIALFGYRADELIQQSINVLIPSRFHAAHQQAVQTFIPQSTPYKMRADRHATAITKDGREITVEVTLSSLTVEVGNFIIAIIQDITERIAHEQKINEQLVRLNHIAWYQSHKVRQPLCNIMGLVDLIQKNKEDHEYYLALLQKATDQLDTVIHKIVEITDNNLENSPSPTPINPPL